MVDRLEQMRRKPAGDWRLSDIEALCKEFVIDCRAPRVAAVITRLVIRVWLKN